MIAGLSSKHTSQPGFLYANTIKAPNKSPNNYFTFKKLIVYYYYSIQHRRKRGKEKSPIFWQEQLRSLFVTSFFFSKNFSDIYLAISFAIVLQRRQGGRDWSIHFTELFQSSDSSRPKLVNLIDRFVELTISPDCRRRIIMSRLQCEGFPHNPLGMDYCNGYDCFHLLSLHKIRLTERSFGSKTWQI